MKFSKRVLPNGLRVVTVPMKDNGTVTAMVLVEAGSRYESKDMAGISHFLEHMCFKGTTKRPSSLAISTEFESMGAQYNAFTAENYTGYYGKAGAVKTESIIELVSDLYLNATLPEEEIEKEKGVVIEEINMYKDRSQAIVHEVFEELVYGEHPLGRPVIGYKDTVNSFDKNHLYEYRKSHYVPSKTVIVISGGFDEVSVNNQIDNLFASLPAQKIIDKEPIQEIQDSPKVKIFDKKTDQTHFIIGFRSFSYFDTRMDAVGLLRTILGSGMSSRLFNRIREELGLCYYIHAGHSTQSDCGIFTISAGVSNEKLEEAVKEVMRVIAVLIREGITDAELEKAKEFKIGNLYLSLETSDQFADWYGFQEISHEEIRSPKEEEECIRKVTKQEVLEVARYIFDCKKVNLAVVGPQDGKEQSLLDLLTL